MSRLVIGGRKQVSRDNRGLDRFREGRSNVKVSVSLLYDAKGRREVCMPRSLVAYVSSGLRGG